MSELQGDIPAPGVRDVQTVTAEGTSTSRMIEGVEVRTPTTQVDHRGALFEIYTGSWPEPIVWAYSDTVRPGQVKGWARHEVKVDRYTAITGDLLVLLHDGRPDSPTSGMTQCVVLGPRSARQIRIPVGVWHLLANLGPNEVHFVNFPTQPYRHDAPDRFLLPWDTDQLPVDVRSYLPKF